MLALKKTSTVTQPVVIEDGCASLGVRGLLWNIASDSAESCRADISNKIQSLKRLGVRRAHIVLQPDSDTMSVLGSVARDVGFAAPDGEKVFIRALRQEPKSVVTLLPGYTVRDGNLQHLLKIGRELQNQQELAFEGWEFPMVADGIEQEHCFFKVVEFDGQPVGVSIGGAYGSWGTISHTWVHPDHRWKHDSVQQPRLGQLLSEESLRALYKAGARRVYLMTTDSNEPAERFWSKQDFIESSAGFLEIDL